MQMHAMTIETPTGTRLAPQPESPFWRDTNGERLSYQDAIAGLASDAAGEAADRHADAVGAVAREAALARLRGEAAAARQLALAASRLCEEIAGFWPRDSWKPIR